MLYFYISECLDKNVTQLFKKIDNIIRTILEQRNVLELIKVVNK